jgi:hypothetical protein
MDRGTIDRLCAALHAALREARVADTARGERTSTPETSPEDDRTVRRTPDAHAQSPR